MLCYLNSNEIAHDVVTTCPVRIGIKKRARCCDYWELARWNYQHQVIPVKAERYSITFRYVAKRKSELANQLR